MESNPALPPEIDQALARGWVVLTANQRAARTLRRAYDLRQRTLGHAVWEPPQILAWDTWTVSLWNRLLREGHASEVLLSSVQEHSLWRDVIAADAATASLRPVDALAETAAGAWKLLHDYSGRSRLHSIPGNSDTRAFARWADAFERRCARAQYLTQPQLSEALSDALARKRLIPWPGYLLVGFDTKTPAQKALLHAVRSAGAELEEFDQPASTSPHTLVAALDEHAELAVCARWLRQHLTRQPEASIAVVAPAIDTDRAAMDRVFRTILAPELNDITAPTASAPYEFSLGIPLARTPLIAAALDILRWANAPLPLDRISSLLLSPHFAAETQDGPELIARAEFDAFVLRRRHLLEPQLSLRDLYQLAAHTRHSAQLPTLLTHLRLLSHRKDPAERTCAGWAAAFHDLLQTAGWAPVAHLDSAEFQTRSKWDDALDDLASLDFDSRADGARVAFVDALAALERIAAETLFAPESRHAPIQIMGPLESAGSAFDAIWFLRASDLAWPAPSSPNPLLAWRLQRELGMPGANPVADTALARRTAERIAASAPTVLFSYAQQTADARQRPSPVLDGLALESRRAADLAPALLPAAPIALEAFPDTAPIPPPPGYTHPGGAGILEAQAACGFRAFAEKRLFSSALDSIALGLDARERGNLVHLVLEDFWAHVETQASLRGMTSDERKAQLERSIDSALDRFRAQPGPGWPRAYLMVERSRLLGLLAPWLDYEADERAPFIVQSREAKLSGVRIGPLHLDVRVDRIDRLLPEPGSGQPSGEIILDYKTGEAKPAQWFGPRPDAPQLPLYAVVSNPQNLAAVAFARVKRGDGLGIDGLQARDGILPRAAALQTGSLAAQVEDWRAVLTALAEDFHSGHAQVSPKNYPRTCQYCQQRLLCRLDPATLENDLPEDPDPEDDAALEPEGFSG